MAGKQLTIVICSLLLLPLISAFPSTTAHNETKVDVAVEGMVYCQSCKHYGSWALVEAKPIPSAKVSVICKNYRKQVTYYKAYETNAYGYFYAQLDGFKMSNNILDHPLHACHVKLVSSPLAKWSLLSNVNYGLYGAPLQYQNKVLHRSHNKVVIYAAGPLAFRPDQCISETHV